MGGQVSDLCHPDVVYNIYLRTYPLSQFSAPESRTSRNETACVNRNFKTEGPAEMPEGATMGEQVEATIPAVTRVTVKALRVKYHSPFLDL